MKTRRSRRHRAPGRTPDRRWDRPRERGPGAGDADA